MTDHGRTEPRPTHELSARAPNHAERCRTIAAAARSGTLATIAREPAGFPYGSLVTVAFDAEGAPLFLLSTLAEHTANLGARSEASLLVTEPLDARKEPLSAGRVTLLGPCLRLAEAAARDARALFLAANPGAAYYVDFSDFAFYRLFPMSLRYVGGFGRMSWVSGEDYAAAEPDPLAAIAGGILEHMNADHAVALLDYALALLKIADASAATMTSVDRYGFEMSVATPGGPRATRLAFDSEVVTADAARREMVALVKKAREKSA
jgi:heme iron utilization protein